jgi:hypothetical protein
MDASDVQDSKPLSRFSVYATSRGMVAAILVAWSLSIVLMLASPKIYRVLLFAEPLSAGTPCVLYETFETVAIYGLPPAVIVVLAIGLPLWSSAANSGRTSVTDAVRIGAMGGAIVAAVEAVFVIAGMAGGILRAPGFLTPGPPLGVPEPGMLWLWLKFAADLACTVGIGAATGVAARLAAGRAQARTQV